MKNTTLCYIEQDGRYLMLHRTKKEMDENKNMWIGIGGKCEEKESPEDCVLREVREETGLILHRFSYRGLITFVSDQWETQYMHLFTADEFEGMITLCDEGELQWVEKRKLFSLPMWEGDKIFLNKIMRQDPFFSLKLVYGEGKLLSAVLDGQSIHGEKF